MPLLKTLVANSCWHVPKPMFAEQEPFFMVLVGARITLRSMVGLPGQSGVDIDCRETPFDSIVKKRRKISKKPPPGVSQN